MAETAIVAILAGSEAVTTALVLTAVTEVGVAMSVVGMVTGNEDLMNVGATLGLVGGVGGLINDTVTMGAIAGEEVAANSAQEAFRASEIAAQNAGAGALTETVAAASPTAGIEAAVAGYQPTLNVAQEAAASGSALTDKLAPELMPDANMSMFSTQPAVATGANVGDAVTAGVDNTVARTQNVGAQFAPTSDAQSVFRAQEIAAQNAGQGALPSNPFDGIKDFWNGLGDRSQATLIGAGASMFSGMQQAQLKQQELELQRQRINQTAYGSAIPLASTSPASYGRSVPLGIINTAKA